MPGSPKNRGGGHDFMDGTEEAFLQAAQTHAQYGTTGMLPTTLTSEKEELYRTLELYAQASTVKSANYTRQPS